MASALKNLSKYDPSTLENAAEMSFGIIVADWNPHITHALYEGCFETLVKHGALPEKIHVAQVPGSFELPLGARILNGQQNPDALICLGCVIKGETRHDEYINQTVASGLMQLSLMAGKPFVFGLLTTENEQQALDRAGGKHGNKGIECAVTAIRMIALKSGVKTGGAKKKIGF
jgi:6,7-dimethyl-8-ribityllumazine synthase